MPPLAVLLLCTKPVRRFIKYEGFIKAYHAELVFVPRCAYGRFHLHYKVAIVLAVSKRL